MGSTCLHTSAYLFVAINLLVFIAIKTQENELVRCKRSYHSRVDRLWPIYCAVAITNRFNLSVLSTSLLEPYCKMVYCRCNFGPYNVVLMNYVNPNIPAWI